MAIADTVGKVLEHYVRSYISARLSPGLTSAVACYACDARSRNQPEIVDTRDGRICTALLRWGNTYHMAITRPFYT
jgi:hypothetical protein